MPGVGVDVFNYLAFAFHIYMAKFKVAQSWLHAAGQHQVRNPQAVSGVRVAQCDIMKPG